MLRIKSCPRCVGDMALEIDLDGPEWVCIQCGDRIQTRAAGFLPGRQQWDLRFDLALDRDLGGGCVTRMPGIAGIRQEPLAPLVMARTAA